MSRDTIVDEVRKAREEYARKFNYDLDAIFRDIKEQEKKSGRQFVSFTPPKVEPNQALQPSGGAISATSGSTPQQADPAAELGRSAGVEKP